LPFILKTARANGYNPDKLNELFNRKGEESEGTHRRTRTHHMLTSRGCEEQYTPAFALAEPEKEEKKESPRNEAKNTEDSAAAADKEPKRDPFGSRDAFGVTSAEKVPSRDPFGKIRSRQKVEE
jgi:hypothetical protein